MSSGHNVSGLEQFYLNERQHYIPCESPELRTKPALFQTFKHLLFHIWMFNLNAYLQSLFLFYWGGYLSLPSITYKVLVFFLFHTCLFFYIHLICVLIKRAKDSLAATQHCIWLKVHTWTLNGQYHLRNVSNSCWPKLSCTTISADTDCLLWSNCLLSSLIFTCWFWKCVGQTGFHPELQ